MEDTREVFLLFARRGLPVVTEFRDISFLDYSFMGFMGFLPDSRTRDLWVLSVYRKIGIGGRGGSNLIILSATHQIAKKMENTREVFLLFARRGLQVVTEFQDISFPDYSFMGFPSNSRTGA